MQIFVVGYPKSGNTWLAKMLCQATGSHMVDDDPTHSDINSRLIVESVGGTIIKSHLLPEDLNTAHPAQQAKVFYILRDYRDVAVSAFFYFSSFDKIGLECTSAYQDKVIHFNNPDDLKVKNLAFKMFIEKLGTIGLEEVPKFGRWSDHVQSWMDWGRNNPDNFVLLRYEDLLQDAIANLNRSFESLQIQDLIVANLEEVVKEESFSSLQKRYINNQEWSNKAFLRKGKAGDWRNYFTKQLATQIPQDIIEALRSFDYLENDSWAKDLPDEILAPSSLNDRVLYLKCKFKYLLKESGLI